MPRECHAAYIQAKISEQNKLLSSNKKASKVITYFVTYVKNSCEEKTSTLFLEFYMQFIKKVMQAQLTSIHSNDSIHNTKAIQEAKKAYSILEQNYQQICKEIITELT